MKLIFTLLLFLLSFNLLATDHSLTRERLFKDNDSLRAEFIIGCYDINLDSIQNTPIYRPLHMTSREAVRLVKKILRKNDGWKFTFFNRPLFRYKLRGYWVIANAEPFHSRKGGGFTIVINSYNWAIKTLIYGK